MSKNSMVKIEELCDFITDGTHQTPIYAKEGYIFLSSKNVVGGKIDWSNVKYISTDLHNQLYKRLSPKKGDILLAKNGTTGVAAVVDTDVEFDIYVSLALLRPKPIINSQYFLYAINNPITKQKFNSHLKGIGVPNLHLNSIRQIQIPLPPLEEQQKIADTLDKVSELIEKRKQQLTALDELIKSTFIEMFGDPVTNPKGWEKCNIGNVVSALTDYHANGGYEILAEKVKLLDSPDYALMIRTTDLEKNDFVGDVKYISQSAYEFLEKSKVYGGEIIINKIGSAGKVYLMPKLNRPVSLAMNQFLLRFKEGFNSIYVYYFLEQEYIRNDIRKRVRGAVTKTITKDAVRDITFLNPPQTNQNKFASFVERVEEQKSVIQISLEELQNTMNALMQEYFG